MTQILWLAEIAAKATILLVAAFVAAALLGRASAAVRHFLWTGAFAALLLLPGAMILAPRLNVPAAQVFAPSVDQSASPAHAPITAALVRPARPKSSTVPWLLLWALGGVLAAVRFALGAARTRRILQRATIADYARAAAEEIASDLGIRRRVAVLEAAEAPVPLACGIVRPSVVLPAGAADWPETRLRTVLLHELSHIRRSDLLAQWLAHAACCLYWFHPLAWLAARRLRNERERACDDAVLAGGIAPHEYAGDLVSLARGLAGRRHAWMDAPAMAEGCDLEYRVRALFDRNRNRRPLGGKLAAAIGAVTLAVLLPLAALTVHAQAARGGLAGLVQDPSGARVPNCRVLARNLDGRNQEVTFTNATGEYLFSAMPAGQYELTVLAPGFSRMAFNPLVIAGQTARADINLQVGAIQETITISGQKPPTVTPTPQAAPNSAGPQRIRIGGMVQPATLISQVKPEYPAELQQAGIQGVVMVTAIIRKDGTLSPAEVQSTAADSRLVNLALDALKQWHYQPSLLNGEPVETVTTMTIDFKLD